jgi:hypothetical protein
LTSSTSSRSVSSCRTMAPYVSVNSSEFCNQQSRRGRGDQSSARFSAWVPEFSRATVQELTTRSTLAKSASPDLGGVRGGIAGCRVDARSDRDVPLLLQHQSNQIRNCPNPQTLARTRPARPSLRSGRRRILAAGRDRR